MFRYETQADMNTRWNVINHSGVVFYKTIKYAFPFALTYNFGEYKSICVSFWTRIGGALKKIYLGAVLEVNNCDIEDRIN